MNIINLSNSPKKINKIKPNDIKNLVQNNGNAFINGKNLTLIEPNPKNTTLQQIINSNSFTVELLDIPIVDGIRHYNINSELKSILIRIYCPHCKQKERQYYENISSD